MADKFEAMKAKMAAMRSSSRKSIQRSEVKRTERPASAASPVVASRSVAESITSPRQSRSGSITANDVMRTSSRDDTEFASVFSITSPRGRRMMDEKSGTGSGVGEGEGEGEGEGQMTKKEKMKARSSLKKLEAMKLKVALMREEKGSDSVPSRSKNTRKSLPVQWSNAISKDKANDVGEDAEGKSTESKRVSVASISPIRASDSTGSSDGIQSSSGEGRGGSGGGSRIAIDRVEEMKRRMAEAKADAKAPAFSSSRPSATSDASKGSIRLSSTRSPSLTRESSSDRAGGDGNKMAEAALKLQEMKKKTDERRKRKELAKKKREGKRQALGSQLESFLSIVTNLEPMLKKLEAEKAIREEELREAQRETRMLRQAATAGQSNVTLLKGSMQSLLDRPREGLSVPTLLAEIEGMQATLNAISAVFDTAVHGEPVAGRDRPRRSSVADIVKERREKRRASVCADAPPVIAPPPAPPPPMPNSLAPPAPKLPKKLKLPPSVVVSAEPKEATRGDLLAQIRQTALRKLDKEQVEQERAAAASDKEGMLFHSLQESVKMALEIRKKAMEAHESDEEDWSDDDYGDDEWGNE